MDKSTGHYNTVYSPQEANRCLSLWLIIIIIEKIDVEKIIIMQ